MKYTKLIKEYLFVIPLGIIINLLLMHIFKIDNVFIQAGILIGVFLILTNVYRKILGKVEK